MGRLNDLTGQRFGRLTVIKRAENRISQAGKPEICWKCVCECGNTVVVRGGSLRSGRTLSCGCLQKERTHQSKKKYNSFRISGDVVYVKMANSDHEMIVDKDIWFSGASKYCWDFHKSGYAYSTDKNGKTIRFHVWAFPDCPKGLVRDHIDGNRLNNTRANIRFITQANNMKNLKTCRRNTSGHKGVSWMNSKRKWRATIFANGRHVHLGLFSDINDAITARKAAEIKYFGEYRRKD